MNELVINFKLNSISHMSLPKKGLRKITIEEKNYGWKVSGNDGWIDLYIESQDVKHGQLLNVKFHYHHKPKDTITENNPQFKLSNGIVKQVINLGLANDWRPLEQNPVLSLGHIDNKVELFPK